MVHSIISSYKRLRSNDLLTEPIVDHSWTRYKSAQTSPCIISSMLANPLPEQSATHSSLDVISTRMQFDTRMAGIFFASPFVVSLVIRPFKGPEGDQASLRRDEALRSPATKSNGKSPR